MFQKSTGALGHEVLRVLPGAITVYLRDHGDGKEPVAALTSGRAFIVPAGRWHRLTVSEPADLLAITPRAGTRRERVRSNENSAKE